MKKSGILNAKLSEIVASLGHGDKLVICDSGLPIPKESVKVDLALASNIPRFTETLRVVLEELEVEEAIIATEMKSVSNGIYEETLSILNGVQIKDVSHEQFKEQCKNSHDIAFIRTGEATPYANIILQSGVSFD
jgi:D-ribose pyranase